MFGPHYSGPKGTSLKIWCRAVELLEGIFDHAKSDGTVDSGVDHDVPASVDLTDASVTVVAFRPLLLIKLRLGRGLRVVVLPTV